MSGAPLEPIAWIDRPGPAGSWGQPRDLALPLNDRGLSFADGLFETILLEAGRPRLLEQHLNRWHRSAALLGMASPPSLRRVERLLHGASKRSGIGTGALRLNWSRGENSQRGIDLPPLSAAQPNHRCWLQLSPCQPVFTPVSTILSREERRNALSRLSRCKTFAYGASIQARREAHAAGADDVLLLSTTGELCCGSTANLLIRRGDHWLTPPLSSGCLPGVMRERALELGLVAEAHLRLEDLAKSDGAVLINSLGCRPLRRCGRTNWATTELDLPDLTEPSLARQLWRLILE